MVFDSADMPSDMKLEDWIPVFEPMEENGSLERHADVSLPEYIEMRRNGELDDLEHPWEEGINDTIFYHTSGNASITTNWGPRRVVEDALMADGFLDYRGDFQGDTAAEVEEEIARTHSAPYIEDVHQEPKGVSVDFNLPTNYDQKKWEETVDTLVAAIDELNQYQGDLDVVSEQYPR